MSEFKEVKDDGGPAFPRAEVKDTAMGFQVITGWCPGMSLRDYFIAHAPAYPQQWFLPEMPPQPNEIIEDGLCTNSNEILAYDREYDKQRYIQWPSAWADEQIKARKK